MCAAEFSLRRRSFILPPPPGSAVLPRIFYQFDFKVSLDE